MKKKGNWLWELYFVYFAILVINQVVNILFPTSVIYTFYHVLIAFDRWLAVLYYVRIFCDILNLVCLIPLYLFMFKIKWLNKTLWQWVVALRVGFDLVGHYYEYITVKSLFFSKPLVAAQLILWFVLTVLPSYYACLKYAFRREKLFQSSDNS